VIGTATGGNASALVRWTAPTGDGGAPVTGYEVQALNSATNVPVGALRTAAATATQLTVTGLTNGTTYTFRVRAVNVVGTGAFSANSNAVTPVGVAAAPATVAVTTGAIGGAATATVAWTAPPTDGGSAITGYRVTAQRLNPNGTVNGAPTTLPTTASTDRSLVFTAPAGTAQNTRYAFTVQAINGVGVGAGRTANGTVR
jgi:predicted phage tail protein